LSKRNASLDTKRYRQVDYKVGTIVPENNVIMVFDTINIKSPPDVNTSGARMLHLFWKPLKPVGKGK
jgi:hypothetical protein